GGLRAVARHAWRGQRRRAGHWTQRAGSAQGRRALAAPVAGQRQRRLGGGLRLGSAIPADPRVSQRQPRCRRVRARPHSGGTLSRPGHAGQRVGRRFSAQHRVFRDRRAPAPGAWAADLAPCSPWRGAPRALSVPAGHADQQAARHVGPVA
ncbi:hypothetical protein OY671_012413, partial [Metschnikowia pulcherrima]